MTKKVKVAAAALVLVMTGVMDTGTAWAELDLSPTSSFPYETTLGDSSLHFQISVINTSNETGNATDDEIPVNLTEVGLTPSCVTFSGTGACTTPELDVFDIETGTAVATGIDGACTGTALSVSERGATGRHTITPDAPVVLGPADGSGGPNFCTLEMTIEEVVRVPATDVQPAQEGVQIRRSVDAQIVEPVSGRSRGSLQNAVVTVNPSQATLFTESDPSIASGTSPVPPGTEATDTATVSRIYPGTTPGPTGEVTFSLMGPNPDATCTGPVAFGPETVAIDPATGQATSSSSGPLDDPGLYNWVATFESGDNNYESITDPVGCNEDQERFVVAQAPAIQVDKTADPTSQPEPGGSCPGELSGYERVEMSHAADVNRNGFVCIKQIKGQGNQGNNTNLNDKDSDDATVTLAGVPPMVDIVRPDDPTSQPKPGGSCPAELSGYERVEMSHPADVNGNGFVCIKQIKGKGNQDNNTARAMPR